MAGAPPVIGVAVVRTRRGCQARIAAVRRSAARRVAVALAVAGGLAASALVAIVMPAAPVAASACGVPADFAARARVEEGGVVIVYRTVPDTIVVGQHFSIDALVCADTGSPVLARVDAQMPEHRHGMNYRPTVAPSGTGRYVAQGLMFHMPGRWQLVFDVERAGQRMRLTSDVHLE
jgi:hypothetical protein